MKTTRLCYYIDPKRESTARRIHSKIEEMTSDFGAEIADEAHNGDEVLMTITGLKSEADKILFKEMVAELLDLFGAVSTVDQLRESARRIGKRLVQMPQYQYAPGVVKIGEVAHAIAEELGHEEWLDNDNHWVFTLVSNLSD